MDILPGDDFGPVYVVTNDAGHTLEISKNFLNARHHAEFNAGSSRYKEGRYYVKIDGEGSNFTEEDLREFFAAFLAVTKDYGDSE